MIHLLSALLCASELRVAKGAVIDLTTSSSSCPPLDGTSRSVWSILGSCALTLLICVWHTVHFNVPRDGGEASLWFKIVCILLSFLAPEAMIAYAIREWWTATKKVKEFRSKGYEWSMTHSFFAQMGGFVYRDRNGTRTTLYSDDFLRYCRQKKITNPYITIKEIRDKSKSDWLGKAILALQLVWFMLQVIVRGSKGLAVTLVELDTVCMAVLSLMVIFLWWHKPLRPECPHIFDSPREAIRDDLDEIMVTSTPRQAMQNSLDDIELTSTLSSDSEPASAEDEQIKAALSKAWGPEPSLTEWFTTYTLRKHNPVDEESDENSQPNDENLHLFSRLRELFKAINRDDDATFNIMLTSLCVTWFTLGGLHLVAWNFEFPTPTEKILWRVASLILAGGSPAFFAMYLTLEYVMGPDWLEGVSKLVVGLAGVLGLVSRAVLVGLMLASLRALPCSAHQIVPWTAYIPHL